MLDLQLIDKGQTYKKLKPSYVIFICPFDLFDRGRHIYTFENICKEDKSVSLNDESLKIFLNASGRQDDVSRELKAFLDYVAGIESEDDYVQKLAEAVEEAKKNRAWRHEYMTLLMRDQENIEKGIEQGLERGLEQGLERGKIEGRAEEIIETGYEFGLSDWEILERLQKKLSISLQLAQEYVSKFGRQTV